MAHSIPAEYRPPFRLPTDQLGAPARAMLRLVQPAVEQVLALPDLNRLHARINRQRGDESFPRRALRAMNVNLRIDRTEVQRIPPTGPLVVVANHPFGALDGVALLALLQQRRADVKILANHLLEMVPEMRELSLFVDPFGGRDATTRNLSGIRAALRWVKGGGCLAVFPAGEVSSLDVRRGNVADGPWSRQVAALIRSTDAATLPVFFAGRNSSLFQCAGLIWRRLRTLLLARELINKRHSTIEARVGNVISPAKLRDFETDRELADYLKVRTYILAARQPVGAEGAARPAAAVYEPVADAQPDALVAAEIDHLPPPRTLARSNDLRVLWARACELRWTLPEIGRLRELTFRRVGEGTGRALDLDRFDESYLHLLVWNDRSQQVVGAYRMGLTDEIVARSGLDGLYTTTLFRYRAGLLDQLGPAIELGRSFVRPEYQKDFAPLMLLWKGIATFVVQNPKYRRLFGPVSISSEYHSLSRQLLIEFLRHNDASQNLKRLVTARNPPRFGPGRNWQARIAGTVVRTIDAVDDLLGEIESDRAGMPVLLRQYLKLNAKLLGFNVDPDFGDVLDGLMLVDLTQVPRAILTRYMGREAVPQFLSHHGL
jgi:putative hemolysin